MKPILYQTQVQSFSDHEGIHFLGVSKKSIGKLGGKFFIRLVCILNDRLKYQCGLMGMGDGSGYIGITRAQLRQLELCKGDEVSVRHDAEEACREVRSRPAHDCSSREK